MTTTISPSAVRALLRHHLNAYAFVLGVPRDEDNYRVTALGLLGKDLNYTEPYNAFQLGMEAGISLTLAVMREPFGFAEPDTLADDFDGTRGMLEGAKRELTREAAIIGAKIGTDTLGQIRALLKAAYPDGSEWMSATVLGAAILGIPEFSD